MPTTSPTNEATRATRTSDSPSDDDACWEAGEEPFAITATGVATFKAEEEARKLRMQLKAAYKPPIVTFRFNVELFGYGDNKKKARTMLFFDVPHDHIAALEYTALVDFTDAHELVRQDLPSGGIAQLRFLLKRPGHIVEPAQDPLQALRPNSQPTRAAMLLLATVREFVLFVPQNTISHHQICSLQSAVIYNPSEVDEQKKHKEYVHWLGTLYGGKGGKVLDPRPAVDAGTPSESGDSTVPMSSPPGYKRVTQRGDPIPPSDEDDKVDDAAASAATPPPYVPNGADLSATANRSGRPGEKRPLDDQGFTDIDYRRRLGKGPRLASSGPPSPSGPLFTDDIAGPAYTDLHGAGLDRRSHVVLTSMLEQVLSGIQDLREENNTIKTQLSAIEASQRELHAQMADLHRQRTEKIRALETASAGLGKRCDEMDAEMQKRHDNLDRGLAQIEERVEGIEEQYSVVTSKITGQVRGALREALRGALGSVR